MRGFFIGLFQGEINIKVYKMNLIKTKVLNLVEPLVSLSDEELIVLDKVYLSYLKSKMICFD